MQRTWSKCLTLCLELLQCTISTLPSTRVEKTCMRKYLLLRYLYTRIARLHQNLLELGFLDVDQDKDGEAAEIVLPCNCSVVPLVMGP